MSLFRRPVEQRSISYQDVWGSDSNAGNPIRSGSVSAALGLSSVYAATGLIADMVSTSPLAAYVQLPSGVRVLRPVQPKLITDPDPYGGTVIDWLHQGISSALITGNAFGYTLAVDAGGIPSKVAWLNPAAVTIIERQSYEIGSRATYYWNGRELDPLLLTHVRGYTFPGSTRGLSPLALFKTQIETGLHAQEFARDWFRNGAAPSGHLKSTADEITPDNADKIKTKFKAAVSNRDVLVTGEDWTWTALSVPADQAKFLETLADVATQVAAVFRLQPDDIGGAVKGSLTYKTLLQDQQRLNQRALRPWARRFEAALSDLLSRPTYAQIDLTANAQGTVLERMETHAAAMAIGVETFDTARAAENIGPMTAEDKAAWLKYTSHAAPTPPASDGTESEADPNGATTDAAA